MTTDGMAWIAGAIARINDIVWGPPMLILLVGTHLFLTFRLRFIQRYILRAIRISLSRDGEGAGDVSQFGALTTALAATIGTGNIVGVATAIAAGGPGAVMWMWLTGVFGIATKYGEALLAVKYRIVQPDGSMAGGPMYVLERALNLKWLAILFAAMTVIASFGIGNMVQANSIAEMAQSAFGLPRWLTGSAIAALTGLVILGGIRSIARVCKRLVPVMAVVYVAGCVALLIWKWETIPQTIMLILNSAFTGQAAVGGFVGAGMKEAIRYGVARGLFSNESGMGSAPIVAAAARTRNPVRQALVSSSGTFWDTVVICLLTGLAIVNTGMWTSGLKGADLAKTTFAQLHHIGPILLAFGLLTFVFSTLIGWSYYGEKAIEYLAGSRASKPFRWLWVLAVLLGAMVPLKPIWDFADAANAMMAIPNLVSLLLLSKVLVSETKKYLWENRLDEE